MGHGLMDTRLKMRLFLLHETFIRFLPSFWERQRNGLGTRYTVLERYERFDGEWKDGTLSQSSAPPAKKYPADPLFSWSPGPIISNTEMLVLTLARLGTNSTLRRCLVA
jgi:hypothetical protein